MTQQDDTNHIKIQKEADDKVFLSDVDKYAALLITTISGNLKVNRFIRISSVAAIEQGISILKKWFYKD